MDGMIDLQAKGPNGPDIRTGRYQHHVLQEDALSGWQQEYHLLEAGRFQGEIAQIDFGEITIFREKTNLAMINRFCLPKGKVNLAAALPGSADAFNHYGEYHKGETFLLHFAEEREVMVTGPLDMIGVTFTPAPDFAQTAHYWHRITDRTSDFINWIALLLGSFARSDKVTDLHRIAPLLIADRLGFVLDALAPDAGRKPAPRSNPATTVRDCMAAIRQLPPSDLAVVSLAQRLDLPAATLRKAFRDTLDQDLDAMLVALRLSHVHRILTHADPRDVTVSSVAADHGFLHWGRFAQHYRAMFGELPVATLRRSAQAG